MSRYTYPPEGYALLPANDGSGAYAVLLQDDEPWRGATAPSGHYFVKVTPYYSKRHIAVSAAWRHYVHSVAREVERQVAPQGAE